MPTRILDCPDDAGAAATAAGLVLDAGRSATQPRPGLALSGGRIARRFFGELVAQAGRAGLAADALDFFWADERCVPPEHPDSNYAVAREALLAPLGVPPDRVHRLEGELDPSLAAERATADWHRWQEARGNPGGATAIEGVVLGVGEDGHVASLFPENLVADLAAPELFRAVTGSKPPPRRLTMGYPILWEAGLVVVLATGAGKAAVLEGSLSERLDTPLGRVLREREARGRPTVLLRQM